MVIVRFDDSEMEKRALDSLVGRYSFKSWANGNLMVPEVALGYMAGEGIAFRDQVEIGKAESRKQKLTPKTKQKTEIESEG